MGNKCTPSWAVPQQNGNHPPYVIYRGKDLYGSRCTDGPEGTKYPTTNSGWMKGATLASWFKKHFLDHIKHIKKPVFVLFDGHSGHITVDLILQYTHTQ